jgi:hypothetical protein
MSESRKIWFAPSNVSFMAMPIAFILMTSNKTFYQFRSLNQNITSTVEFYRLLKG